MAAHDRPDALRRCFSCADVVGVYERAVFVLGDGSAVAGSPLSVEHAGEIVEAYHEDCSPAGSGEA